MATKFEQTGFTNVVRKTADATNNNNQKNDNVVYRDGFTGKEIIKPQPISFKSFGKTTRINSAELAKKISEMFRPVFHEFKGCNIIALPNGQFQVIMYFERNTEPVPDNKILNLESLIDADSNASTFYRNQVVQNRKAGKVYTLNNETKLLLSKYMWGGQNANKPNNPLWNNESVLREIHVPVDGPFYRTPGAERIVMAVTNFDIHRLLQDLYGGKMITETVPTDGKEDKNYIADAMYEPRFIRAMSDGTFIMNIEQFDKAEVEAICIKENPIPQFQFGNIPMY